MKKKSRFLTGLLSAVMALSLFALPAAAADETGADATAKVPTITKTTGSLTINKYEGDKPVDDKRLDGVTFTNFYKVADIQQSTTGDRELTYKWADEFSDNVPTLDYTLDANGSNTQSLYNSVNSKMTDAVKTALGEK